MVVLGENDRMPFGFREEGIMESATDTKQTLSVDKGQEFTKRTVDTDLPLRGEALELLRKLLHLHQPEERHRSDG